MILHALEGSGIDLLILFLVTAQATAVHCFFELGSAVREFPFMTIGDSQSLQPGAKVYAYGTQGPNLITKRGVIGRTGVDLSKAKNSATNVKASNLKRDNKLILVAHSTVQPKSEKELKMGKNQHVVPHDGKWAVKGAGNQKATSTHSTQSDAIDAARGIAQNQQSEVVVHRPDGRIRDKDSYGNDPCPPRDTKH